MKSYKWLILGGGPGGISAARNLCLRFPGEVLLVEGGPDPRSSRVESHSIREFSTYYKHSELNYIPGLPLLICAEGAVLGGGSQINSGFYHRLPDDIRESWEKLFQIEKFTASDILVHAREAEELLELEEAEDEIEGLESFNLAGKNLGFSRLRPRLWWSHKRRFFLSSMASSLADSGQLHLLCSQKVLKIEQSSRGWRLEIGNGDTHWAENLVLACGARETRKFMAKLSGQRLSPLLHHPYVRVVGRLRSAAHWPQDRIIPGQWERQDLSIGFSIRSAAHLRAALSEKSTSLEEAVAMYGSPRIAAPLIEKKIFGHHYLWTKHDRKSRLALREARQSLREFAEASGLSELVDLPGVTTVHLFGGIPFGEHPACLADSFGRVKSQNGLYIADGSLLCTSPRVNPQGAIMMLANRNSRNWCDRA